MPPAAPVIRMRRSCVIRVSVRMQEPAIRPSLCPMLGLASFDRRFVEAVAESGAAGQGERSLHDLQLAYR